MNARPEKELAEAWLRALENVDEFRPLVTDDAQMWHSNDNRWVPASEVIDAVRKAGGLPPRGEESYTLTEDGFLIEFTVESGGFTMHNVMIVQVRQGKAHRIREYVGAEMDLP